MSTEIVNQDNMALAIDNKFIDDLSAQIREKEKCGLTFPSDYNPTNELTAAYLILKETVDSNKNPVLKSCSRGSIASALMNMVTSGVSMAKKQCYPIAYKGKLQCQMSVYGNTCIARRYGLKEINALCIYQGDDFKYRIENGKIIVESHVQDFMNIDTSKIIGAYAVATMQDGSQYTELMNMDMIRKAWSKGYGSGGTHKDFTDQMCMKTVKNRCLKYIIRTYGEPTVSDFVEQSNDIEDTDVIAANVEYEIQTEANKEKFVLDDDVESVSGEVVEETT